MTHSTCSINSYTDVSEKEFWENFGYLYNWAILCPTKDTVTSVCKLL